MRRTEALQGVRMIKFRSVFERYEASELNQIDAAALERTFRRWCVRFEDGGEAGLLDRRVGQASGRRVPSEREFSSAAGFLAKADWAQYAQVLLSSNEFLYVD